MSEGSGPITRQAVTEEEELELEVLEPDGTRSRVICVAIPETPAAT
jgi:hypothetical protein